MNCMGDIRTNFKAPFFFFEDTAITSEVQLTHMLPMEVVRLVIERKGSGAGLERQEPS